VRLVADESVDKQIVDRLPSLGHEILYIAEFDPGIDDDTVLRHSHESGALLLTSDKDFGELVFRQGRQHSGILLVRLAGISPDRNAEIVAAAFELYGERLQGKFSVASERSLRTRRCGP
jgi:predicted nuclease of predicted toxin-antitoxin system